jgi:hypothetical protein
MNSARTASLIASWVLGCTLLASADAPREPAPQAVPALPVDAPPTGSAALAGGPDALLDSELPARDEAESSDVAAAARDLLASLAPEPVDPSVVVPSVPFATRVAPRQSMLPVPPAPPPPAPRKKFELPLGDPAAEPARTIARRVPTFRRFRAEVAGAAWEVDEGATFAIRRQSACLHELARLGVRTHPVTRELSTPVPAPVAITAPVEGVSFVSLHLDREVEVSCELAARLPALARILRKHGVRAVGVNSSYRDQPKVSFHTFGLALDIAALRTATRTLLVATDFEVTPDALTCDATPSGENGRLLLAVICDIARSHLFSSVITPNYNEGHRDHFHLDMRPDDPNLFVR